MCCVGDAKIFLKEIFCLQEFLLFQYKSYCSSKNELRILTELLKNVIFKYFFIMTVTITMLGEESWWSKYQKLKKKTFLIIVDHYCQVSRVYQLLTEKSQLNTLAASITRIKGDKLQVTNQKATILQSCKRTCCELRAS